MAELSNPLTGNHGFDNGEHKVSIMQNKQLTAVALCLTMLLAGCLNVSENVEVPDVVLPDDWSTITARTVASPQLFAYDDCEDLESSLKQSIEEQYRVELLQAVAEQYYYPDFMWAEDAEMAMDDGAVADTSTAAQPRTTSPPRVEGEDFSGTNNQESGVDEADFVKTDGYHIYYLQGQHLHIFGVPEFGELEAASNMSLSGNPVAMMLDGDQLVVISTMNPWSIDANHPVVDAMGWDSEYRS